MRGRLAPPGGKSRTRRGWLVHARAVEDFLGRPGGLVATLLLAALVVYGYEIFSFHLTIDEEYFADSPMWRPWVGDGRWGMALLSAVLLPRSVTPVIPTLLGVWGVTLGLLIFVRTLTPSRSVAAVAVAMAMVYPTLPFAMTFSTLSYGVGVGAVAVAVAHHLLVMGDRPERLAAVVALNAFAIAIYQPFVFALPVMTLMQLLTGTLDEGRRAERRMSRLLVVGCVVVPSVVLYLVIAWIVRLTTGIGLSPYIATRFDVAGLLGDPIGRLLASVAYVIRVLVADPGVFLGQGRLVGAVVAASLIAAAIGAVRTGGIRGAIAYVSLAGAGFALLVMGEAITPHGTDLRALVYVPFVIAGVVVLGLEALRTLDDRRVLVAGLAAAVGLASVGLAADNNRLFLSSAIAYDRDVAIATRIDQRVGELAVETGEEPVILVLIGVPPMPDGPLRPKRDTFGASFFEWDGGNPGRAAQFMRIVTGRALEAGWPDLAGTVALDAHELEVWPHPDSVRIRDGVVAVRFGEPTPSQEMLWCEAGVAQFCR